MNSPSPTLVMPQAIPPPVFGQVQGKKPQQKSMTPSYLGSGSVPTQAQTAPKTLLGQ